MKNLGDVGVPLMTHLGDNMRGAPALAEDEPRVNDSPLIGGDGGGEPQSQDLAFNVKWLFMPAHPALILPMA